MWLRLPVSLVSQDTRLLSPFKTSKKCKVMRTLFDSLPDLAADSPPSDSPPLLSGIHDICLNVETTGLKWFDGDRLIAVSIYAGDRSYYLPFGHRGGGNLDEAVVKRW